MGSVPGIPHPDAGVRRWFRWTLFLGFDIFISYRRGRNASRYVRNLSQALQSEGLTCFVDQEESEGGEELRQIIERAARRSRMLVVLAEPRVTESSWVPREIALFRNKARRKIVPVNVDEFLKPGADQPPPFDYLQTLSWLSETRAAFNGHVPSEKVVQGIRKSFTRLRVATRSRLITLGVMAVLILLAAAAWWQKGEAEKQRDVASRRLSAMYLRDATAAYEAGRHGEGVLWTVEAVSVKEDSGLDAAMERSGVVFGLTETTQPRLLLSSEEMSPPVAISPHGTHLAIAKANSVELWSIEERERKMTLQHPEAVEHVALDGPGEHVLTRVSSTVRLWNAATGSNTIIPVESSSRSFEPTMSTDARHIVLGTPDSVVIWNMETEQVTASLAMHSSEVHSVLFGHRSSMVATLSDNLAIVTELPSGETLLTVESKQPVVSIALDEDGRRVAVGTDEEVTHYDLDTGERLAGIELGGASSPVQLGFLEGQDKLLVLLLQRDGGSSGESQLRLVLWGLRRNTTEVLSLGTISTEPGRMMLSSGARRLALVRDTGFPKAELSVLEAATGMPVAAAVPVGPFTTVMLDASGATVVTVGQVGRDIDEASLIGVWDVAGTTDAVMTAHYGEVRSVEFGPDGMGILTASDDGTARLWDARTGELLVPPLVCGSAVHQAVLSPDGQLIATVALSTTTKGGSFARVWSASTGEPITPPLRHPVGAIFHVSFSPDGGTVATSGGVLEGEPTERTGIVQRWDSNTGERLGHSFEHTAPVRRTVYSPDGKLLLSLPFGQSAYFWDVESGTVDKTLEFDDDINSITFSPDGSLIATASDDGAHVWVFKGIGAKESAPVVRLGMSEGAFDHLLFSPDGGRIATISRGTARIWDPVTGEPTTPPLKHQTSITHAVFFPEGKRLLTATRESRFLSPGGAGVARVWDALTGAPLTPEIEHAGSVNGVAVSPDGSAIAMACEDHVTRILRWPTNKQSTSALRRLATVVSRQRLDPAGGLSGLQPPELSATFLRLVAETPDALSLWAPPSTLLGSHRPAAAEAKRYERLAEAARFEKQHERAIWAFGLAIDEAERQLSSEPGEAGLRRYVARLYVELASQEVELERLDSALEHAKYATLLFEGCDEQYQDAATLNTMASLYVKLVRFGTHLYDAEEDLEHRRRLVGVAEAFRRKYPAEVQGILNLGLAYSRLASALNTQGQADSARERIARSQTLLLQYLASAGVSDKPRELSRVVAELVADGGVLEALDLVRTFREQNPQVEVLAETYNSLCWHGALRGLAEEVLAFCDRAVQAASEDTVANYRDSRGVARALQGDLGGAIEDLEAFCSWARSDPSLKGFVSKRERWLAALRGGRNPLDESEIASLREEAFPSPPPPPSLTVRRDFWTRQF